eukprot:Nitzschia sp. Nitz4//scaffold55_size114948//30797//32557//NITZ4_003890-RA/size114948-augustus-gene-0.56-mRNA-1//1//CDS//3329554497//1099//frame0
MQNLQEGMGRLSTSAREWTPQSSGFVPPSGGNAAPSGGSSNLRVDSDLNAAAVKEFVPGQGWSTQQAPRPECQASYPNQDVQGKAPNPYEVANYEQAGGQEVQEAFPSTVPAGPNPPPMRSMNSLGMADDLWRRHRQWQLEKIRQLDSNDPLHKAIPQAYCNPWPLDFEQKQRSSFGYPCTTFQVVSRENGHLYCLRRFDNVRSVNPNIAAAVVDRWSGLEHPHLVTLHRCFVSQRALFFVHQYIPGVMRLRDRLLGGSVAESVLWSAICQWTSLIRRVHQANLAVRVLDSRHVLVQMDPMRLRWYINCVGVVDALEWETQKELEVLQSEDIRQLGRLILSLATGTEITANTDKSSFANCEHFCRQTYSQELHNLAMTLVRSPTPPSIRDVSRALAGRVWDELDNTSLALNHTERALATEFESGRMTRILMKLGFVNERPEFGPNRRWAQSGDCYILSLFRDFVFHQADGAGNPVMDLGHVVAALNKLDAADGEKIVLSSRDGKSLMVVSYADVAHCLESAYHELCSGSVPPRVAQPY